MNISALFSQRVQALSASGLRRWSEQARTIPGAINLSIGQPDFAIPEPIKLAAIEAIRGGAAHNGYTANNGVPALQEALAADVKADLGWDLNYTLGPTDRPAGMIVTSGTSGAIALVALGVLNPGDEVIIPDPYFVQYPHIIAMAGATPVVCDTHPDFHLTASRVEKLITPRTKMVLFASPGNPSGVVMSQQDGRDLLDLCRRKNILLVADEIYDRFTFAPFRTAKRADGVAAVPSPAREPGAQNDMVVVRGFGKTYGVTGWRLGMVYAPSALITQLIKIQQYVFTCAPVPLQHAMIAALKVDMDPIVAEYHQRSQRVLAALSPLTEIATPGGAFYAYVQIPARLGMTATQFATECLKHKVILIPGGDGQVFSNRDTHVRLSFAVDHDTLTRGLEVIAKLLKG